MRYGTGVSTLSKKYYSKVTESFTLGWTYQQITFNNCQVGFDIATGGLSNSDQVRQKLYHTTPMSKMYWLSDRRITRNN